MNIDIKLGVNVSFTINIKAQNDGVLTLSHVKTDYIKPLKIKIGQSQRMQADWPELDQKGDEIYSQVFEAEYAHPDLDAPLLTNFKFQNLKDKPFARIQFQHEFTSSPSNERCLISGQVNLSENYRHARQPFENLRVAIFERGPDVDKKIAEFNVVKDGIFSGTIDAPKTSAIQAKLYRGKAKAELAISDIVTVTNNRAEFTLILEKPKAKGSLFSRLDETFSKIKNPFPEGEDERALWYGLTDESRVSVRRYFNAQALAKTLSEYAETSAVDTFQDYQNSLRSVTSEHTLAGRLVTICNQLSQHRLPEVLFALLIGNSNQGYLGIVNSSRKSFAETLKQSVKVKEISAFAKTGAESLTLIVERLATVRDGLHFSFAEGGNRNGALILLADPKIKAASLLFDYFLDGKPLIDSENKNKAILKIITANEHARLIAAQQLISAVEDYPLMAGWFMAKQLSDRPRKPLRAGQGRSLEPAKIREAASRFSITQWVSLAKHAGVPEHHKTEDDPEQTYAAHIVTGLLGDMPREAMITQLEAGAPKRFKPLANVLKRNPGFDFREHAVDSYFSGKKRLNKATRETFKTFARLDRIVPTSLKTVEHIGKIADAGFSSARDIVNIGKIGYTESLRDKLPARVITQTYCGARVITDMLGELQIQMAHSGMASAEGLTQAINGSTPNTNVEDVEPPTLAQMFGSLDSCACTSCQSVHSPAAYLHNLLHWMKSDVKNAYPRLLEKRPDIPKLLLNCANTHTVLPYIDLVNEALSWTLDGTSAPSETTWNEEVLRLQPEYRYLGAEAQITQKKFPLALPYHRTSAEGRAALSSAGEITSEVMATFLNADRSAWSDGSTTPQDNEWAAYRAARLNIDPAIYDILVDFKPDNDFWEKCTGVDTSPGRSVGDIMTALGLGFEEMDALVRLDFIAKDDSGEEGFIVDQIKYSDSICSYSAATYEPVKIGNSTHTSGFDALTCSRALRLLRLSKITAISTAELSDMLWRFSLAKGSAFEINHAFLGFLSAADELEALCGISLNDVLSYLELPYPNGTPDRYAAFAQLCTTRTGAEIELAEDILPFASLDLTDAEQMATFLNRAIPLFTNVTDLSAIRPMPMADNTMSRADKLAAAPSSLFSAIINSHTNATIVSGDLPALEALILETVASHFEVPLAVCQTVYAGRGDSWIIEFDGTPPAALSDVPELTDYANALWGEGHHIWMHDMLAAYAVSQDLIDIAVDEFEPDYPNTIPDYSSLPDNFAENLWSLRNLANRYRATELELSGWLIGDASSSIAAWLLPAVTAIDSYFQGNLNGMSKAQFIEKSLRLEQHARILGVSEASLATLFGDVQNISWDASATDGKNHNIAAEIFRIAFSNASSRERKLFESSADEIRKDLRDALLALLITQNDVLEDVEDVYRLLLLDPAMQPCMMTSRLKLATGSVQLLMHRAMMNLEGGNIQADEDDQQQWEWRKNYRVWEANTKILLYPENWIDPSLRLNPTPLFENSIALLAQDEVTEESSQAIVYDYLSGLDKIARLDIRAFYRDEDNDVLHVFGRTWVAPYEHYYRRREDGVWTHWEKIDIDIEADHIIPVIYHRRLWLFWPIFIEKQSDDKIDYKEIKLAYTTYEFGKWRGKKLLGKSIIAGPRAGRGAALKLDEKLNGRHFLVGLEPEDFLFVGEHIPEYDELIIMVRRNYKGWSYNYRGGYTQMEHDDGWVISGCNSDGELAPAGYTTPNNWKDLMIARPYRTVPSGQNMVRGYFAGSNINDGELYVKTKLDVVDDTTPILSQAPDKYTLTYPQQKHALWDNPFFMMDSQHTHFYERKSKCVKVDYGLISSLDLEVYLPKLDDVYEVSLHEHPYACEMIATFNQYGADGIYGREYDGLKRQALHDKQYYGYGNSSNYKPSPYQRISHPYPRLEFDFEMGSAYGIYNWELFFHLPTLIARQLKSDGRHSDAIRWLSMVFDPTSRENIGPRRVWRIKPFMTADSRSNISALVQLLGQNPSNAADRKLRKSFEAQLKAWRETPFEPHRIAEHRLSAYMMWAALEYVDVLIEWGDALFKQDSMESINEATNLYLLANAILGKRPSVVEKGSVTGDQSFEGLNTLSTSPTIPDWVSDLEGWMMAPTPDNGCKPQACHASVFGALSPKNYFCIPPNPKLPEYWDRVEDRLFKIRHCRNMSGEQRSLALFQPPIDPDLLVRARASGLSVSDVIAGLTETGLGYRFQFLLQKAEGFTAEVKSFGGQLLSALEKRDGEELSLIQRSHEINIQKATRNLKKMSLAEAKESLSALQYSRASAQLSYDYYSGRDFRNSQEIKSKDLTYVADGFMIAEQAGMLATGLVKLIPDLYVGTVVASAVTGGSKIGELVKAGATAAGIGGSLSRSESSRASTLGSFNRRMDDWNNQAETTQERLKELDRQIAAAEIRLQTAEKDLEIFENQIEQTQEIYDYMKSKFSGEKLYSWMANTLKTAHRQAFKIASNMARQAQMAANRELRDASLSLITADQWDSSRAGLLAGERLSLQLKQLDNAYCKEKDRLNIYELTRTISLRRLDPTALYALKSGEDAPVAFKLPKWLFQSEHNGKGLKDMRIQSVALSLPCTTGPNAKVDLKLRLTSGGNMASKSDIITSTAQSDAGRFDPNPNGNSYLPFENENVDSEWEITLPKRREFNPITINDVILTVRYTAIAGETGDVTDPIDDSTNQGYALSLRHDFYAAWLEGANQSSMFSAGFIFPKTSDTEFLDRVPYVYEGKQYIYDAGADKVYVLTRVDGKINIHSVSQGDNVFSHNGSAIEYDGNEVVDIISIVKVT